ncbi:hypothetical protein CLOM_g18292 [Closterium sp. NIES-68]|nr:hypothetical protein CLOM_g18292 [Closterium sp. NIES-68]GJP60329.1 hypothetical protein CLOP_g17533 [Closterium sp. NIES-67]
MPSRRDSFLLLACDNSQRSLTAGHFQAPRIFFALNWKPPRSVTPNLAADRAASARSNAASALQSTHLEPRQCVRLSVRPPYSASRSDCFPK